MILKILLVLCLLVIIALGVMLHKTKKRLHEIIDDGRTHETLRSIFRIVAGSLKVDSDRYKAELNRLNRIVGILKK